MGREVLGAWDGMRVVGLLSWRTSDLAESQGEMRSLGWDLICGVGLGRFWPLCPRGNTVALFYVTHGT